MNREKRKALRFAWAFFIGGLALPAQSEVVLQYFNNTWNEIADKMPEIAEVGYGAMWLPPPQKASGDLSVGYDLWDPFDLGGETQRTGGRTRYGTEEELLRLIETAHRFGIRVYFDNIMNHRAFQVPGYDENTPIDIYPGMLPEDFHLQVTEEGFYRAWGDTVNWGSAWEIQNQNLSGLIDIAQETPNANFGKTLGSTHPKIFFVRHPNNPEYYDYHPTLGLVGFGNTNITTNVIAQNQNFYKEDTWSYSMRSVRWLVDKSKVDGLRLDAVKHVPAYFFGNWDDSYNGNGYSGEAQVQYNRTRGFSDGDHRDTMFDTELARDDLMVFGEHMGEPPPYWDYFMCGMRLIDAKSHQTLNDIGGNASLWKQLQGSDYIEGIQFGSRYGVYYAKSHDDAVAYNEHLHYANYLTRAGLPNIYTDGNRQAETLGQSGGAFPRHANTNPFGQWGDDRIPNLVGIHNSFSRGWQIPKLADDNVVAYDRIDKRENGAMTDGDGVVMSFMMSRNYNAGEYREIPTSFPNGSWLWQYSSGGGKFYHVVTDNKIKVMLPQAGYFAFSWRSPEESDLWKYGGGKPITIYENDKEPGWVSYKRTDGPDGDPGFNPYGVADSDPTDFTYSYFVPRITSATNIDFVARVDGSAFDVMFKLDGGVPLNNTNHSLGDARDNPPALSSDVYMGYEQAEFSGRFGPEKFAAVDSLRNKIGSAGAETYQFTVGSSNFVIYQATSSNDWDGAHTAVFVYHDPNTTTFDGWSQFYPPPQDSANSTIYFHAKSGNQFDVNRMYLYYTTDGVSWPEGAGGKGIGNTKVTELFWRTNQTETNGTVVINDWWSEGQIPAQTPGTVVRYKIGATRQQEGTVDAPWDVPFPNSAGDIARKLKMMGVWQSANFNASNVTFRPHMDYGMTKTGLVEGFHFIQARAFLQRDGALEGNGKRAAIYDTFKQTFYLDTKAPEGEIKFPVESEIIWDNRYGIVVRTDPTVTEVWYNITDSNAQNDDGTTGQGLGNGTNTLGGVSWVKASKVNPSILIDSQYPVEWRFNFINVPTNSPAAIRVKLAEISSSTNPALSDVAGHFRTLTRNVTANGPDYSMSVAWPQNDGDTVGVPYGMKVWFSKALANSIDEATLRSRFLIKIDDVAQGRDSITFNYNVSDKYHELIFPLPDMYNGDQNYIHEIEVTHTNAGGGGITLFADRRVKAQKSTTGSVVTILDPPEFDLDGAPYNIVLPDVANPSSTQRLYQIRVQTDTAVQNLWISFTNSVGFVNPVASSSNLLTGTLRLTFGSKDVSGTGTSTLFNSELRSGAVIQIGTNRAIISQILSDTNLTLTETWPGATGTNLTAWQVQGNPTRIGSKLFWSFIWTNLMEGTYTIVANADTNNNLSTIEAQGFRTTRVLFRESVNSVTNDLDDDDDGLYDTMENSSTNLPTSNAETWVNGDVHIWMAFGRTDPLRPDTDGDGLPDGLEVGWRGPIDVSQTDTNMDTNGDGWKNFRGDMDPPFFNTVPDNWDVPDYNFNDSRTKMIAGSMTDPSNPDSDSDGLPDGIEDADHNGWVNGDGDGLGPNDPKSSRVNWPDGEIQNWETWTETEPNNWDTDSDGAADGYGEDKNLNGWIDGDTNSNRLWSAGELWTETNPIKMDTDGDGLSDGWEIQYGFDPLDRGVIGYTNMRTGAIIASELNGASGNPDNDFIVIGVTTNAYSNLLEFQNGTNPWQPDDGTEPPEGSLIVGTGQSIGFAGGKEYFEEFSDWTADDCLALDEYEGAGNNQKSGDVYPGWTSDGLDGFDTSRDIIAFYARDGGNEDGKFYFRLDFYDLQAYAEEQSLDIFVAIDFGTPGVGEKTLPDDVDTITEMRWEAVVACYQSGKGAVYVDTDHINNSTVFGQDVTQFGVVRRDQTVANGFIDAHFNSQLDAVEMSISRQALIDAGWNGLNPASLNYQVYVTKDGTCNGCNSGKPGAGDLGGRTDIRDTILDDYLAEDFSEAQSGIDSTLRSWIPGSQKSGRAKVSVIAHANQSIQPGSTVQKLINDNLGAGYYRLLDIHQLYKKPLNLHITPTLASAIEWASVDTNASMPWLDGPTFNDWIGTLIQTNIVRLFASTFSDHMMPYFTPDYIIDNEKLAREYLENIYDTTITTNAVFWTPERLIDADVFTKIKSMGYRTTVLDQMEHLFKWYGRSSALGTRGFQINKISDVNTFAINNGATDFRFDTNDSGLSMPLRRLFNRKARSDADQVTILFSNWEDFANKVSADAYDVNMRWIANHPWIQLVTLEDILAGNVDLNGDEFGDNWYVDNRGTLPVGTKVSHDYINYASELNYDNWYLGSSKEEGLQNKIFNIRPGVPLPKIYGMMYTAGIATDSWSSVKSIIDTNIGKLARSTLHASVFQSAFHNQSNTDLRKFSNGEYINPDSSTNNLAAFAGIAQAQTRFAAMYKRVDTWVSGAAGLTNSQAQLFDVDLDGENEYLLYNSRLLAIMERSGGRMVAAFVRDPVNGRAYQTIGNTVNNSGSLTEEEGTYNALTNGTIGAYRTSAMKDWWAGTSTYVNDLYTFTNWTNGWRITSADGKIQKTITLGAGQNLFNVAYNVDPTLNGGVLYVRNGLAPNLYDLLLNGQEGLSSEQFAGSQMTLSNVRAGLTVAAMIGYSSASMNSAAVDDNPGTGGDFKTRQRRNQAQTHQVELFGTNTFSFTLGFAASSGVADTDGDGMPDWWEQQYFGGATNGTTSVDNDGDSVNNYSEYVAGTNPGDSNDYFEVSQTAQSTGITLWFPTSTQRLYRIWYANHSIMSTNWQVSTAPTTINGTGGTVQWTDNGSGTIPHPNQVTNRFYKIDVQFQ